MSDGIVIAGGGLAAQRCCETLRAQGHDGPIRVVCAEPEPPYDRPPLSKELLAGEMPEEAVRLRPRAWYEERGIELVLGTRVTALAPGARSLSLSLGPPLLYEQLLIATGARPRTLPQLAGYANVSTLRTLADARRLAATLGPGTRLVVIGAGFIGLEVASTARGLGAEVTLIEAGPAPLAGVLGARVGNWFAGFHREEGIEVLTSARIGVVHGSSRVEWLELDDGRRIACDHVLVAIGCVPDTAWLARSGLGADGTGIPVDSQGRSGALGVYAAGDAALAPDPLLGQPVRSEHWESAAAEGAGAARAMLGLEPPPPRIATFWSDQHGLRVQCVGHPAGADSMTVDGEPASRDFTVFFTRAGQAVAALLVGRPRRLAEARRRVHAGIQALTLERSTT